MSEFLRNIHIMSRDYRSLTRSVESRINPENRVLEKSLTEDLSSISYSDVLVYLRYSMNSVGADYTRVTKEAGENAKGHLSTSLTDVVYRYQGSVMTDTHIRAHSDIDLLVISDKFYAFDSSRIGEILDSYDLRSQLNERSLQLLESQFYVDRYSGNSISELQQLRMDCEGILSRQYSTCDTSKGKSVRITNLNLRRNVDVVISNWYDDVMSIVNSKGEYRGIQVYNKDTNSKGDPDYPFLSIERINNRSADTNGRLKKMIRFLKNVKADSSLEIDLSSFDINAICYDIEPWKYREKTFVELVGVVHGQLSSLLSDTSHSDRLTSVDGREFIFRGKPGKLRNMQLLFAEVISIFGDISGSKI